MHDGRYVSGCFIDVVEVFNGFNKAYLPSFGIRQGGVKLKSLDGGFIHAVYKSFLGEFTGSKESYIKILDHYSRQPWTTSCALLAFFALIHHSLLLFMHRVKSGQSHP
jgi:hypothetical protein